MYRRRNGRPERLGYIKKVGNKWETSYPQTAEGTNALIKDFYDDMSFRLTKTAGGVAYGTDGAFRAIMGKEITLGVFSCNNAFTVIGALPYQHEGVRIQYDQPTNTPIGAGTVQDGVIPDSVQAPIEEIREPGKDLPFVFDYGLGLMARESYDDTIAYDQYVDNMINGYSNQLDRDLLRPTEAIMPNVGGKETSITPLSKIVASSLEVGQTYGTVTITAEMVSPYGGVNSDLYAWRSSGAENNFDSYVDFTSGLFNKSVVDDCYEHTAIFWDDSGNPNNKIWLSSLTAQQKLNAELEANHIMVDEVYVQQDFNGVKTFPGRDGGMALKSYKQVPWFIDGNMNFDATTGRPGSGMGDAYLTDLRFIFWRMITPVEYASTREWLLTKHLSESNGILMRGETGCTKFIGHGKICNKTK